MITALVQDKSLKALQVWGFIRVTTIFRNPTPERLSSFLFCTEDQHTDTSPNLIPSAAISEHRARIQEDFEDSPSLWNYYAQVFDKSYSKARDIAAGETGLDLSTFPVECPYTAEQVLDDEFWPG